MRRAFAFISILWLVGSGTLCAGAQTASTGQVVTAARLADLAKKTVTSIVSGGDREVVLAYNLTDQRVPAGDVTIVVQPAQINATYVAIPLAIAVDGRTVRTVFAGYRIVTYMRSAVAVHDLPFGTVVSDGDVVAGRVASNGRRPVDAASLIGRQMSVAVNSGSPVFIEQTRMTEMVRAGQAVMFILHDGPVVLSADVIARSSGGLGQTVGVYNPSTHKELSGVVTGPAQVEYTLPGGEGVAVK